MIIETMAEINEKVSLVKERISELQNSLELILELHPTKNEHEDYVIAVREIAKQALKDRKTK